MWHRQIADPFSGTSVRRAKGCGSCTTHVRVEVCDPGPGFDRRATTPERRLGGEGGYGLLIVEQVADRWGVTRDHGARVWFEIDRDNAADRGPALAAHR